MIFLFDVDGVLVQPGGYRVAVRATVNHFAHLMGLGDLAPDDETVAIYESQGVTCEWDMVPITVALALEAACEALDVTGPMNSLAEALSVLRIATQGNSGSHASAADRIDAAFIDYPPKLRGLSRFVRPGEAPAESLLAAVERAGAIGRAAAAVDLFPRLAGQGVLRELFTNTRRPAKSRTTHVFETFVLGDAVYTQAMGLAAEVQAESTLTRFDRPLLDPAKCARLQAQLAAGGLGVAAYTARPSAPSNPPEERLAVYAPEAEQALALVGLDRIPLVGSGQMGEAGQALGVDPDRLTKPAPYHALMAMIAAQTGDRLAALNWTVAAFRYFEAGGPRPDPLLPERLDLHVFEDSPTGMMGAKEAAARLQALGTAVEIHLWGVSQHPEKVRALEGQGARVFEDINQALGMVI